MAKLPADRGTPEQYEETTHPDNPPASSARPAAVVAGMWYYLGPLAVLVLILVFAAWFMLGGDPIVTDEAPEGPGAAATTGQETPGLFGPELRPNSTLEELEYRGAGEPGLGASGALATGQTVQIEDAVVSEVQDGRTFSIEHRGERVMVIAPQEASPVRAGMRVDVSGTVEADDSGGLRIRATRVASR